MEDDMVTGSRVGEHRSRRKAAAGRLVMIGSSVALLLVVGLWALAPSGARTQPGFSIQEYGVAAGSHPHDAVPDRSGFVWYTGQADGTLGRLDPSSGDVIAVPLGAGSAPHGIILGPDGGLWVTDGGLNAIVRVDPTTLDVRVFPLPGPRANLNTATFDGRGVLWFTGQSGYIGRLDPSVGVVEQFETPRGRGPYGIATAPNGTVYFASLAGSYLGRIDGDDGSVTVIDPPTANAGVRRVWPDSQGRMWVSEYNAGQLGRYDPARDEWTEWRLPGDTARPYAIYVDEQDRIWLSDAGLGGQNAGGSDMLVFFEPNTERFTTIDISKPSIVAQLAGVPGDVWGGERGRDHVVVVRYSS
jgi:virginiamycin B lyase